ncbi:MAG: EamA family transporter [Negativicutes bacterium]|nr:EamA family transporter [Negativicutes bacterium]
MTKCDWRATVALLITIFCWGSAFPAIRAALAGFSPGSLALLRFLIAALCFLAISLYRRDGWPRPGHWPRIGFCGLCGVAVYHLALNYGETTVSAGVASVIIATGPLFIALAARIWLKEKLGCIAVAGIAVAFAGTVVLAGISTADLGKDYGILLVLLAAVATAGYTVGQKPLLAFYDSRQLTGWMVMDGTILLLPFSGQLIGDLASLPATGWQPLAAAVYLGLFPSALAYSLWSYALNRASTAQVSASLYLSPVVAYLVAWLWLGEIPRPNEIIGSLVIFAGILLVNLGRRPAGEPVRSAGCRRGRQTD